MDVQPPARLLEPLEVPRTKVLMGPGPSNCSPRVLHALGHQLVGHLHPECTQIMDEIKEGLQYVFQTRNKLTLAVSATGHGGMEAALCNLIEPGEVVLIANHGIWGQRAANMASRYGAVVKTLEKPPGQNFEIQEIEYAISKYRPGLFFITQGESSTGVFQPLEYLGATCHRYNCLLVVDAVASLGGVPLYADLWELDVVYTGSQKVLGAPPGLCPITFSERAVQKIKERKSPIKVFYFDMTLLGDYWSCFGKPRIYHHTIPVSLLYALREGLAQIAEEGLENCWERHRTCAAQFHDGLQKIGLKFYVTERTARLPTVTSILVPPNLDQKAISEYAMRKYAVEISGGLGPTQGKIMRVGIMGYNATSKNVLLVLTALKEAMKHSTLELSKL